MRGYHDPKAAPSVAPARVMFDAYLPHGSLLAVTAEGNRRLTHSVPPDPDWNPEGTPDAVRYSVIFRTIKSVAESVRTKKRARVDHHGDAP